MICLCTDRLCLSIIEVVFRKVNCGEGSIQDIHLFRGRRVISDWPEKVQKAQAIKYYEINGRKIERVKYGEEEHDWKADIKPCHDCCAIKGEFHVLGCDVEQCPQCKGQAIDCGCISNYSNQ